MRARVQVGCIEDLRGGLESDRTGSDTVPPRSGTPGETAPCETRRSRSVKESSSGSIVRSSTASNSANTPKTALPNLPRMLLDLWQRRRRIVTLPRSFIEKFTPGWAWLLR